MTDVEWIAALSAENKDLRQRIARAIALLSPDDEARKVLEIPDISGEFKLSGSVTAIFKRVPRPRKPGR